MKIMIKIAIGVLFVGIIIIATDFQWLWLPLAHGEQYPSKIAALFMAVSAWVTLLVVFAAFQTIKQRDDQVNLDRKELILNEIIKWAIPICEYMLSRHLPPFEKHCPTSAGGSEWYLKEAIKAIVIAEFTKFRIQSVYIVEISKSIPEVQTLVNNALKHLRGQIRLLNKYAESHFKIGRKNNEVKASINIARNEDRLYDSALEIIKKIGNINSLN